MPLEEKSEFTVIIDQERCKGCGLCVWACPKNLLKISEKSNKQGLFPAKPINKQNCIGCGDCYTICPEGICIGIYRK